MVKSILSTSGKRAFVLPTVIMLAAILVLLTGAVLSLGTGGLRTASHDLGAEQAAYAAEYGLVKAAEILAVDKELSGGLAGKLEGNDSSYVVSAHPNNGLSATEVLPGVVIPPGTIYLRSRGTSSNKVQREMGALFRLGLGAFQVGALADSVIALNATFDAYNSSLEAAGYSGPGYDPTAKVANQGILASNISSGPVFDMTKSQVEGTVFVGPGGRPSDSIVRDAETIIANESTLKDPINVDDILVPDVPPGEGDEAEFEPEDPLTTKTYNNLTVNPNASGSVSFGNSCFSMTVQPNGDFVATENPGYPYAGGNLRIEGNIHDIRSGLAPTVNTGSNKGGGTGFGYTISDGVFKIGGSWHSFSIDSSGQVTADGGPSSLVGTTTSGYLATQHYAGAPDWLVHLMTGDGGGVEADTPPELKPGEYDKVSVDGGTTNLADDGVYVVKNLEIKNHGTLALPAGRDNVTIYVTQNLSVEGQEAIANLTRKAPNLKIFYTGTNPVNLQGGSKSYFTLMAPKADISLIGEAGNPTDFFGAMVGKKVTVENANFHYDTSTEGIGTGADASALTLLSRHR